MTTDCPRCDQPIDLDQSGVNGVCWGCGVLWQKSGRKSPRRALLQRNPLERNKAEELNDAINLIGKYCIDNLPDGWVFRLRCQNDEISVELEDPNGNDIDDWEQDESSPVVDACDFAQQVAFD